ncbi:MAG TPA: hypothetical protein ENH41_01275 [Candidatus Omnitrophica bacterium]|nr:hypothetical protein [Candidatus Omnitrophota bacterium]
MFLDVSIFNPQNIVFKGKVKSIVVPGEQGVFEVGPFHKRILSRLISGKLLIDGEGLLIRRGIIRVDQNKVTVIIEEA